MESSCERDKCKGSCTIKILVYLRDQMDEWLLERGQSMILLIIFVMNNIYV